MIGNGVPCDVHEQTVRVYEIHTELDSRTNIRDDKILVMEILGPKNPMAAYSSSANSWDVVHKRLSYPGDPSLKVHQKLGVLMGNDIQPEYVKAVCSITNEDTYS